MNFELEENRATAIPRMRRERERRKGATSFSKKELQRTKLKRKGKERNGKKEEL